VYQGEKALLAAADRQTQFKEDQFRNFGPQYAIGKINEASDLAIKTMNDPTIPYDKALVTANMMLDSVEKGFNADPRISKIIDKPAVAATSKLIKDQITAIKSNLKSFASKEDASTYMKNSMNILRDQQFQDVSKVVNPQMLDVLAKLTASVGVADFISKQPDLKVNLYNGISQITAGLPTNSAALYSGPKNPINKIVDTLAKEAGAKEPSASSLMAMSNSIKSIDSDISQLPMADKFSFYGEYTKTLGSPANTNGISKLDDDSRSRANGHVNEYAGITLTNMKEIINKGLATGDKVSFGTLPDGRLTVTSTNPRLTAELNGKFIPRINDSIAAIANLNGHTTKKEAAREFFNTHKQFFLGK
jgi:hypothetical protein